MILLKKFVIWSLKSSNIVFIAFKIQKGFVNL